MFFSSRIWLLLAAAGLSLLPATSLQAATLCVNPHGTSGCYSHINDAIAAANTYDTVHVAPGTYQEAVVITKTVSLRGETGAIIDATGLSQGIFVNGIGRAHVTDIFISNLFILNAKYEGILIANASGVTVNRNHVLHNDQALTAGTCPDLPDFETNEQSDCGEGIHLLGADHVILTENVIEDNSGGILLADDTGPTHDNLITGNTVRNNGYACGITMASHKAAAITGSKVPLGVFHNTVYGNRSSRNGLLNGGGAGIGIFASIPGAKSFGNVVANNIVFENGLPGIAMHAHAPGQNLSDNVLVGNTIYDNGPDFGDASTNGKNTGINLYGLGPVYGTIIADNFIQNEAVDIGIATPGNVTVHANNLSGLETGLQNFGTGQIDATGNWWNCAGGPPASCSSHAVGPEIQFAPWLIAPLSEASASFSDFFQN